MDKVAFIDLSDREHEVILKLKPWLKDRLRVGLDLKEAPKDTEILVVGAFTQLPEDVLDGFENLKAIVTRSTGYDHIPLEYCRHRGISVYNIPDYGTNAVAEFTLLLILSSLRRLKLIHKKMYEDTNIHHRELEGRELRGKTVAVLGTGRIGRRVIELLQPFNVKILAYNRSVKRDLVEKYGVEFVSLEEALKNADVITVHLPLNKETYHLLNGDALSLIKPGAVIVNTARGSIIDTEALAKRLDLLYVGLDVIEGERLRMKETDIIQGGYSKEDLRHALLIEFFLRHKNAILTPHVAYNTEEANTRRLKETLEIVEALTQGAEPEDEFKVL